MSDRAVATKDEPDRQKGRWYEARDPFVSVYRQDYERIGSRFDEYPSDSEPSDKT